MSRKRKENVIDHDPKADVREQFRKLVLQGNPLAVTWAKVFVLYADVPCPIDKI